MVVQPFELRTAYLVLRISMFLRYYTPHDPLSCLWFLIKWVFLQGLFVALPQWSGYFMKAVSVLAAVQAFTLSDSDFYINEDGLPLDDWSRLSMWVFLTFYSEAFLDRLERSSRLLRGWLNTFTGGIPAFSVLRTAPFVDYHFGSTSTP